MKIKRFEAPNMSEALRMIKKDFGEDAVILSAKSMKPSRGVFGSRKAGKVVVTAAVDRSPVRAPSVETTQTDASAPARDMPDDGSAAANNSDQQGSILDHYTPITKTGRQKLRSRFVQLMSSGQTEKPVRQDVGMHLSRCLKKHCVDEAYMQDFVEKTAELLVSPNPSVLEMHAALSQVFRVKGIVAGITGRQHRKRCLVMVGARGVGKTTMVAKLAADAVIREESVVVISFDDQRIAGTAELERYAQLMNISMHTAFDEEDLRGCLAQISHADVVVVDTPGICRGNGKDLERLKRMLSLLDRPEIHLLVSATATGTVLDSHIKFFGCLKPGALAFTQLDWVQQRGELLNTVMRAGLPVSYISETHVVTDGIQTATADSLAGLFLDAHEENPAEQAHQAAAGESCSAVPSRNDCFVANRNSDIFHRMDCRAVQRIHNDNIVMFENEEKAKEQSFKPCRMCCSDLFEPKTIERPALKSAAGSRCYA